MTRRALFCALYLLLAGCGSDAAPWSEPPSSAVDLRVSVAPTEVALMQPVTVTVDLYSHRDAEVSFAPSFDADEWAEESRDDGVARPFGDGLWRRISFVLRPISVPGELQIPELRAEARSAEGDVLEAATSPQVTVLVKTVLSGQHGAEVEAPGAPIAAPGPWWWWAAALAGVVAVALAWASRRRRSQTVIDRKIEVPAHVRALRELQRWRGAPRATDTEVASFYVGVSQVLRVYLEQRFGLHAPERTTEEFLRELESGDGLARRHRADLERFLSQCDLVKFANVVPGQDEHERTFALAEAFVESTRADRAAAAEVAT